MKNILIFLAAATSTFAQTINTTAPIKELEHYGVDFTDTDNDGMTDVAELRYGFDPNDKDSFPSKYYTFLSGNTPTLHESTGVTDPLNEIRFEFTESEYTKNRQGTSNLDKLKLDREFLNLAMPILLDELGVPPDSFIIKISCLNRGVYANGTRISVNDDSPPQSFIHEIGHAWKYGWKYSFMKSPGVMRRYFRGFEEGFAEALVYIALNKFAEAYPTHSLVKEKIVTSRNAQTWRGKVYDFDVALGEPALQGGTFWSDKFTEYRYENSSGVFTILANQREGVLKDLLRAFYVEAETNPTWDWTRNSNDIFELWEGVIPTINGIDTSDWLSTTGLLNGTPAPQKLYVSFIDEKVFVMYPDTQGNFSWKHSTSSFSVQKIPSWFPTKIVSGKVQPNVANLPFNVNVKTINGESVVSLSKTTIGSSNGLTSVSEIVPSKLPVGLYRVEVEFPTFANHSSDNKTSSYIIGGQHTTHPKDKLSVHVGLDMPNVESIKISLGDSVYKTDVTNGLAIFRFDDVGIDHTGMVSISVTANGKVNTYKRAVSHFGLGSGERLNQFLIVDTDFDNVEDAFDASVVSLNPLNFTHYSEIKSNANSLANPITTKVQKTTRPKLPDAPIAPPSLSNPIDELKKEIASLKLRVVNLTNEKTQLAVDNNNTVLILNKQVEILRTSVSSESVKVILANEQLGVSRNKVGLLLNIVEDLNKSVVDLNGTLQVLEGNLTTQQNNYNVIVDQHDLLKLKNSGLEKTITGLTNQVSELTLKNSKSGTANTDLNIRIRTLTGDITRLNTTNGNLNDSLGVLNTQVETLTSELQEAIRVAQVPFTSGWFYDPEDGWLYTDANVFPLVYEHKSSSWHFYELGSHGPRHFYSYETGEWHEWE
jgi:hypothetical protein